MKVHHVKVRLGQACSGFVWIDGQQVPNVSRVRIEGAAGEASSVLLELTAVDIECEVIPEVESAEELLKQLEDKSDESRSSADG